jgi:hypothetical protein
LAHGTGAEEANDLVEKASRLVTANLARNHRTCKGRSSKISLKPAGPRRRRSLLRVRWIDAPYGLAVYLCLSSHRKPDLPIKGLLLPKNLFQQLIVCFSPHLPCVPISNAGTWRSALLGAAHWASDKECAAEKWLKQSRAQHESRAQAKLNSMERLS